MEIQVYQERAGRERIWETVVDDKEKGKGEKEDGSKEQNKIGSKNRKRYKERQWTVRGKSYIESGRKKCRGRKTGRGIGR